MNIEQHAATNGYDQIRPDMIASMCEHAITGQEVGGFLAALFGGDLYDALARADADNQRAIVALARFVVNVLPIGVRSRGWGWERSAITRAYLSGESSTPPWADMPDRVLDYWLEYGSGPAVEAARAALGRGVASS